MHKISLPPLLLALAMTGAAAAQSGGNPEVASTELAFAAVWPETGASTFHRAAPARIGDDPLLDAVVLRTRTDAEQAVTHAVYLQNPSRYDFSLPLGGPALDVAVLPGAAPGGRAGALVLHAGGLALYTAANGSQVPTLRTDVQAPAWAGAQRLWVATAADGVAWALALDAAGTSLLRATWAAGSFTLKTSVAVPPGVTDIVDLQWDGAGNRVLAMLADSYVYLFDFAGNVLGYAPVSAAPPGGARNRIAVSRGVAGGGVPGALRDLLVIYSHWFGSFHALVMNQDVPAQWVALGTCAARDLVTADRDGDGLGDLLLAEAGACSVRLLRRSAGAAPCFDPAALPLRYDHSALPADTLDLLLAGDFDADGDADLIGLQSERIAPPQPARRVTLFDARIAGRPSGVAVEDYEPPLAGEEVHIQVAVGAPDPLPPLGPGEQLRVRVEVWVKPNAGAHFDAERWNLFDQPHDGSRVQFSFRQEEIEGFDPATFVLQMHVHFAVIEAGGGTRRYGSSLHHFAGSYQIADPMHNLAMVERGEIGNPGGGDGNATGNTGGNRPPGDGQTP